MPSSDRARGAEREPPGERIARILVVDDLRHLEHLMQSYLKRTTCRLLTARHGAEALRLCQKERPDLVILGASLAEMDGLAVCRALKGDPALRDIPVAMVAARDRDQECRQAGSDEVLHKPVTQEDFLAAVRRFVPLHEREEERTPISLRVEFQVRGSRYAAYTRDLSPHGLFLKSRRMFAVGTRIDMTLELERGRPPLALQGEVRRIIDPKPGTHLLAGLGIRFVEIAPESLGRLQEFIAARRQASSTRDESR